MRRMMLTEASCPSNSDVAVTNRTLFLRLIGGRLGGDGDGVHAVRLLARARASGTRPVLRGARRETQVENTDERLGDLAGRHGLILTIPMGDPVERTRQREGGHLEILRLDGPVAHPLLQQAGGCPGRSRT